MSDLLSTTSAPVLLWMGLTFMLAGFSKGAVGMGMAIVAMGALGLVMPPAAAAAMLVIPSLVTNLWQLFNGPILVKLVRRLGSMMVALCVGTLMGIGVITGKSSWLPNAALGAILIVYAALSLAAYRPLVAASAEPWASPLVGFFTGVVSGATGVFVFPAVPYLNSLNLDKEELIQALGLTFTVSALALAAALAWKGHLQWQVAGSSLLALVPTLLGMWIGQRVRHALQPQVFRKWFLISLLAIGVAMLARALTLAFGL